MTGRSAQNDNLGARLGYAETGITPLWHRHSCLCEIQCYEHSQEWLCHGRDFGHCGVKPGGVRMRR